MHQFSFLSFLPGGGSSFDDLDEDPYQQRAVSPHGHVYWEIDPSKAVVNGLAASSSLTASAVADLDERYSRREMAMLQERMPLLAQQQQHLQQQQQQQEESPLLQQVSQMNHHNHQQQQPAFVRNGAGRYNRSYHRNGTAERRQHQQQQQQQQQQDSQVPEQLQQQVQIRDCRPIQVSVKSSEYIEAKIRTLRKGN